MAKKKGSIKKTRDTLLFLLAVMFISLLRLLPRRPAIGLLRLLGLALFHLAGSARKRTVTHLKMAYGDELSYREAHALARRTYIHFATVTCDILRMSSLIRAGLDRLITAEGIEHLEGAMREGRGVILVTCHFGNWELLGAWLAQNGYPMKVVGTSLYDPRFDRILVGTRNRAGYTNIARGKATREIIRTLKENKAIGMLIDQDTDTTSVFVDFFGRPAHTPTGPAVLARKLGVPIVPIFMYLKDDLSYHVICRPPLDLVKTGDEENDIRANTQMISDSYEEIIRRFPEQWGWMHKRWYTQPDPENPGGFKYLIT